MCMLCVEINKQNMTVKEIYRAYKETNIDKDHVGEFYSLLRLKNKLDDFLDEAWIDLASASSPKALVDNERAILKEIKKVKNL